ncbi:MAG: phosphoenolpyruvate--protein phosphotransferase [Planctomycetota bacterium]
MILKGRCISPGHACGPALLQDAGHVLAHALGAPQNGPPALEHERLQAAFSRACVQLDRVRRQLGRRLSDELASIFDAHIAFVRDAKFVAQIEKLILQQEYSAESAVAHVVNEVHTKFRESPVSLVRDKAADILDIGRRLVSCLVVSPSCEDPIADGAIVFASTITPSELVRLAHEGVAAAVTEYCGLKSHTAILARGLGIPFVTGIKMTPPPVLDQTEVLVDGAQGRIVVAPAGAEGAIAEEIQARITAQTVEAHEAIPAPVTRDGVLVKVLLNISDPSEAEFVGTLRCDGVGLFRTEFLYMSYGGWPSEQESLKAYRRIAGMIGDAEFNIRLADFGAEKCPTYADIPINRNPSLGLRGLRFLLQREDVLAPQLRAISRLSMERPLTVLLPMLDTVATLHATIRTFCRILGCRSRADFSFGLGTMIEVPSAALMVDEILSEVDSIAIGLNDLTQYLLAADRDDEFVEGYHDAMQPVVLRLLESIIQSADRVGKPATLCGELAGDAAFTAPLLALGARRLSVSQSSYRSVVGAIRGVHIGEAVALAGQILGRHSGEEVRQLIRNAPAEAGPRKHSPAIGANERDFMPS